MQGVQGKSLLLRKTGSSGLGTDATKLLGKAFDIIAVCIFGPNLPTEKRRHEDRLRIWRSALSAAQYSMSDESIEVVLRWQTRDRESVVVFLLGFMNTSLVWVRTELSNRDIARSYAQSFVFGASRSDAETQRHFKLGLDIGQSVMGQ
jgi:hypothetical protein